MTDSTESTAGTLVCVFETPIFSEEVFSLICSLSTRSKYTALDLILSFQSLLSLLSEVQLFLLVFFLEVRDMEQCSNLVPNFLHSVEAYHIYF